MRLTLIALLLLAVAAPATAIDLLPDDAHFSKAVTLDLKGEALSDVTRMLSKEAEVTIRASKDVADQKVTILVDSMPIRDVMNHLAVLFGWSWAEKTQDDGHSIYIIYDPLRNKREADRKEALDRAWKALGEKLDSLARDTGGADSFFKTIALRQYQSLSPDLRKAFLSGMHVCYYAESPDAAWHPSQAVMDEFANAGGRLQSPGPQPARDGWTAWTPDVTKPSSVTIELCSAVNADEITAQGQARISFYHPDTDETKRLGVTMSEGSHHGYLPLCTQPIDHPSQELGNALPDKPSDGLLSKKASISAADLVSEGAIVDRKSGKCLATRTDLLSALHKKLGLQVISDYYSSWGESKGVQGSLKQIIEEEPLPGFPATWGWDGGVLYSRVKDTRTADSREIPNRFLRPWQAVVKRQGCRGLEELAQAAAFLSDDQREAILDNHSYLRLGECKEIDDVGGWESPVLRLYGLLTPKQKNDIFTSGVGVLGLTLEQRNALAALCYAFNSTRAGVYNSDGLNTNEPQVVRGLLGTALVTLRMTCSGSFTYLKPGDDIDSRVLRLTTATTPEEALLAARHYIGEDSDPRNVVAMGDAVYTLAMIYDGYTPDESLPQFSGSLGASAHSTYHRVRIKAPERKERSTGGK